MRQNNFVITCSTLVIWPSPKQEADLSQTSHQLNCSFCRQKRIFNIHININIKVNVHINNKSIASSSSIRFTFPRGRSLANSCSTTRRLDRRSIQPLLRWRLPITSPPLTSFVSPSHCHLHRSLELIRIAYWQTRPTPMMAQCVYHRRDMTTAERASSTQYIPPAAATAITIETSRKSHLQNKVKIKYQKQQIIIHSVRQWKIWTTTAAAAV